MLADMKKLLRIFVGMVALGALSCLSPFSAQASGTKSLAATLSAQDKQDLSRIEAYLNGLKNVSADFLQIDGAGGMMRGDLAIARPGKMRVTYAPPSKDFIIADGSTVHIWDDELQAQTNVDQETSLAQFILRDPVKLNGEVTITKIERFPAKIEITLVQTKDPDAGKLTLVFEDKPLKLRQWKVIDPQGRTTGVNLENMSTAATFPPHIFVFTPPNFGKNR